jgi:hypothetical protein
MATKQSTFLWEDWIASLTLRDDAVCGSIEIIRR